MKNNDINKGFMKALSLNQHITPQPVQLPKGNRLGNDVYMLYGTNNLYPNFLLELYNNSAVHKGIINSKVDYILGEGLRFKGIDTDVNIFVNPQDTVEDFLRKITRDFVIFNYYAVEVIYGRDGSIVQYNHIPAQKIRTNRSKSTFWYSDDWFKSSPQILTFDGWSKESEDLTSKIYFYSAYTPSVNDTYPVPEYSGAIKSIETDIAIRDFHINNINNGFSVSTIISFFNGEPPQEIKDDIQDRITGAYTGTKGQKMIINYANQDSQAPTVENLSPSEWNDEFITLKEDVIQDIISAHSLTSPLLAGIKTSGQLGSSSEIEVAYQIFKNLYVVNKRKEILSSINILFDGFCEDLEIIDTPKLFSDTLDSTVKSQIMTINELRESQGLTPLPDGDRLINEIKPVLSPVEQPIVEGVVTIGTEFEKLTNTLKQV